MEATNTQDTARPSIFDHFINSKKITPHTILALFVVSLAVLMTLYYVMTSYFGAPVGILHRFLFVFFILMLAFILHPLKRAKWSDPLNVYFYIDLLLVLSTLAVAVYFLTDLEGWQLRFYRPTLGDTIFGTIGIFLVLEATRRVVGKAMFFVALFFILHTKFASFFPGVLNTVGTSWKRLIDVLFSDQGVFAQPIQAMSSYIILFLLFGALLDKTGAGTFFTNLAYSIAGRMTGGPAKTACMSSAFFGSISGSAVANVVATGSFTIPLMKRTGYKGVSAGAIEAVASTGGNYMPPIMGAVAFLMAQYLKVPYINVVVHGIIPALLFYAALIAMVHFEAKANNVTPLAKDELPSFWKTLRSGGHLLLSVVILVYFLVKGYTAIMAAFWGILILFLLSFFKKETMLTPRKIIAAFEGTAKSAITVGVACACAGIIMGCMFSSGLGMRLSNIIISAAGGKLWLTLLYTAIISIILGMGMPSVGVYLILVVTVIPTLLEMGVLPVAAHFFAFYFAVVSNITPPVCVAAFAGAAIAGASPMKTGVKAFQYGMATYLIPFMFVYNPSMLMVGTTAEIVFCIISGLCGVIFLAGSVVGWFVKKGNIVERLILFAAAILLIIPELKTSIVGLILGALVIFMQRVGLRRNNPSLPPSGAE
ncbi:MAG TPA: TRAP transporter permease [Firmicutes bacterium]|nr:TRAP transporter permease [Bacillota bacterium]